MTDWDGLMRAICHEPGEDTPRLALADHVEELGSPEFGEFIRTQVELSHCDPHGTPAARERLHNRERELWTRHGRSWFGASRCGLSVTIADPTGVVNPGDIVAGSLKGDLLIVRRGLGNEVRISVGPFTGDEEPCPACEGQGPDWETGVIECRRCDSTGVVGGPQLAAELFAQHPVTEVRLTDVRPYWNGASYTLYNAARHRPSLSVPDSAVLPPSLYEELEKLSRGYTSDRACYFIAAEDAVNMLSRACVNYGRAFPGLPPLPNDAARGLPGRA